MTRELRNLVVFSTIAALLSIAQTASAQDPALNRDKLPSATRFASSRELAKTRGWLEKSGLSVSEGSFVDDVLHLAIGVGYPINATTNFGIAARNGLHFGISF